MNPKEERRIAVRMKGKHHELERGRSMTLSSLYIFRKRTLPPILVHLCFLGYNRSFNSPKRERV